MLDVLSDHPAEMAVADRDHPISDTSLMGRTKRSTYALAFGARYGVCTTRIPA